MSTASSILVVEDNDFVRLQIATFLREAGYEVVEASDGDKALDLLDASFGLAVVDVRMEPVGGFEFIGVMRTRGINIPVVLVTADQDSDLLGRASAHGVAMVLMKPVQKDRLVSMVGRLLQKGVRAS